VDVVHRTFYRSGYLSRGSRPPMVVTVYDMTPEIFPELFPRGNPHRMKKEYVRRAQMVLCISESTRRDLLRIYGAIDAPVVVTHLGVGARFAPGAPAPTWCPDRYVLFLGSRDGYMDFRVALEAFAEMARTERDSILLAVGGEVALGAGFSLAAGWQHVEPTATARIDQLGTGGDRLVGSARTRADLVLAQLGWRR
jgi:glycosyltransferase involved in cell wall biosynthesis